MKILKTDLDALTLELTLRDVFLIQYALSVLVEQPDLASKKATNELHTTFQSLEALMRTLEKHS